MALPKIETPKYTTAIPSTGAAVEYRPFLVKEEKILLLAQESNDEKQVISAITDIIDSCTFGKTTISKLTPYDVEYLFLQIRGKSVGETIALQATCNCSENPTPTDIEVNIDDIQVQYPDVKPEETIQITDTVGMKLRPISFSSVASIDENDINSVLSNIIESIYDAENVYPIEDVDQQELYEFIDSLDRKTMSKVEDFITNQPKLSHEIVYDCSTCGKTKTHIVEGLTNFFT